jgi:L-threonylcarbamoyladenylate synthase
MPSDFSIRHAAHIIKNGGVIAYPTDTVYGLGCDPYNADTVDRINQIKNRPSDKHFILLASSIQLVQSLFDSDDVQKKIISKNLEPTSWVVDANANTPDWLTNKSGTITIRISQHPVVKKLCSALGHPIISTSANLSGKKPAKNGLELHQFFYKKVDKILLASQTLSTKPSKIIRLCDNHVIRE